MTALVIVTGEGNDQHWDIAQGAAVGAAVIR